MGIINLLQTSYINRRIVRAKSGYLLRFTEVQLVFLDLLLSFCMRQHLALCHAWFCGMRIWVCTARSICQLRSGSILGLPLLLVHIVFFVCGDASLCIADPNS